MWNNIDIHFISILFCHIDILDKKRRGKLKYKKVNIDYAKYKVVKKYSQVCSIKFLEGVGTLNS